jgi:MFS family permease
VVSDRVDRRLLLLWADITRAVAVGFVAFLVVTGQARLWHLAALSVVYGLGAGVAAPAFDAIVPDLVPAADLEHANALDQFLRPAMLRLAGPAVGGTLVAVAGAGSAFALNALSFVVSAGCVAAMSRRGQADHDLDSEGESPSLLSDALVGLRFVRERVWLWGTFAAATVAYLLFIGPTEVLLPYVVRQELGGSAGDLGLILAAGGVGAIAAAVIVGFSGLPRRQLTFMYVTWALATLAVAGYGLALHRWELGVACFAVNALEAAGTIAWATTKQRLVPQHLMGRVSSIDWLISIAGLPISYALTAPAAAVFGARATLLAAGVIGAAITIGALFLPGMRAVDGALPEAAAVEPAAISA